MEEQLNINLSELDQALADATALVNAKLPPAPPVVGQSTSLVLPAREQQPKYRFVHLAEQLANAQVEAAEQALTSTQNFAEQLRAEIDGEINQAIVKAENNLQQAKQRAEQIREQVRRKDEELADLNGRLERFGKRTLDAHAEFTASPEKE